MKRKDQTGLKADNHILVDDDIIKLIKDSKLIDNESSNSVLRRLLKNLLKKEDKKNAN